jgi:hypothetical protein
VAFLNTAQQQRSVAQIGVVENSVGKIHTPHLRAAHIGHGQIGVDKRGVVQGSAEEIGLAKLGALEIAVIQEGAHEFGAGQVSSGEIEFVAGLQREAQTPSARIPLQVFLVKGEKFSQFSLEDNRHVPTGFWVPQYKRAGLIQG